jgi:hypothetical protein
MRHARLLGSTKPGLGALMGPFELPEPTDRGETLGVHLRAVLVTSLAVVARLGPQLLDPRRTGRYNPRVRALRLRSRAIWSGSVRLRNSPMLSSSRTARRWTAS